MKVLHIGKFYPPVLGGMELFLFDMVEALSKHVQCDVLCANINNRTVVQEGDAYTVIRAANIGDIFSTSMSPATIGLLKKLRGEYDLIHLHLPNPMANLAYFIVRPRTKLVLHWHSDILKQKNLMTLYKPLQEWLLKRADLIVATSLNYLASSIYLRRHVGKCVTVPLGLNPERLKINYKKVCEIRDTFKKKPIIFAVGRLVYYKGLSYLIEAMKSVDAYLLIGGAGPLEQELRYQIKKANLTEKVFMLGRIEQEYLGAYYQACDIFTLPSIYRTEAFGLVQVEAMYFGKPLVSTDIPGSGVSFVNRNEVTGFLVTPKSSHALVNALSKLVDDPELREEFGMNGKKRLQTEFHIEMIAERILNVYELLLSGYRGQDFSKVGSLAVASHI